MFAYRTSEVALSLNLMFSHSVAVILFRTHRHPFTIYKLFELRLVTLQGFLFGLLTDKFSTARFFSS
jgi:hypothetical protein